MASTNNSHHFVESMEYKCTKKRESSVPRQALFIYKVSPLRQQESAIAKSG